MYGNYSGLNFGTELSGLSLFSNRPAIQINPVSNGACDREELVDLEPNTGKASQAEDFQTPYHRAIEPPRQYRALLQACLHYRHLSAFVITSDEQKSMPRTCPVCDHSLLLW